MTQNSNGPDPLLYYQHHVFCCMNVRSAGSPRGCCADRGAVTLRNYMKDRVHELGLESTRINGAQCLDRCEYGPVMVIYPEGVWYQYRTKADIDEILETHFQKGGRVLRLMLTAEQLPPLKVEA
jgi:(2Fe-2S) ferredoxin